MSGRCAVYIVGAPGVGKSTLMSDLLAPWHVMPAGRLLGRLRGHPLVLRRDGETSGVYLGEDRPRFPGTDALSMSAHPDALLWAGRPGIPGTILGEGSRLGTAGFLEVLASVAELTVIHLQAEERELDRRRSARGSRQSPSWARGAATRAARAAEAVRGSATVVDIDTTGKGRGEVYREAVGRLGEGLRHVYN